MFGRTPSGRREGERPSSGCLPLTKRCPPETAAAHSTFVDSLFTPCRDSSGRVKLARTAIMIALGLGSLLSPRDWLVDQPSGAHLRPCR